MLNVNQTLIDTYRILSIDKSSSDYMIYSAENIKTNSKCSVRQIYSKNIERYQQIFDILKTITNDNFQKSLDFFTLNDCIYIIQESIDGKYIDEIINNDKTDTLNIGSILKWTLELTLCIEYLYKLNVHHNLDFQNLIIKNNRLILSNLDINLDDISQLQADLNFIGKFLELLYNKLENKNMTLIDNIIDGCKSNSYTDYNALIQDINVAITQQKKINSTSFIVKLCMIVLFLTLAVVMSNLALKINSIFLIISIIFVFIGILLLTSLDTNLLFYNHKKASKKNKYQFEVIKNITIVNTNDVI